MSLSDIVSVTITAATTTPTRLGFGTPLIARVHTVTAGRVAEYKSLTEITDAGFATTDPAVLIATKIFSQNPRPSAIKIGKRENAFTQDIEITPINTAEFYVYSFEIGAAGGALTTITYTNGGAETVATICAALQPLIDAIPGITATDNTTDVSVATDTAGALFDYRGFDEPARFTLKDITADPGLAADLTAIETEDPDGWYALVLDSNSEPEIAAGATFIEARKKIFLSNTSDSEVVDNVVTTDVMSDLQASAFARSACIYSQASLLNWTGAAWAGNRLPSDPGSSTWAYKTLAGVIVDSRLTGGQVSVIESKGGNVYRRIAGVNVTTFGIMASGEFIDITRFIDWLDARIKERIFGVLINNAKIPFTDSGVDIMRNEVLAQLQQGIVAGGLAADPAPTVLAPLVADIDTADKANRILPDITFQATLAGAIHTLQIDGVLSV
jgi:hypothetical protein